MALLLGQFTHPIHEGQGGSEIGKLEGAHEVMFIDDIPLRGFRQLMMNFGEFVSLQRRNTAAAGNAISVCKHRRAQDENPSRLRKDLVSYQGIALAVP